MPAFVRLLPLAVLLTACSSPVLGQVRVEAEHAAMGTPFRIVACAPDSVTGAAALEAAFARIDELDSVLSDYDPDSEVSRISRSYLPGRPVEVSVDLAHALSRADYWWRRTDGAFDAALGALTRRWRHAMRRGGTPDPARIDRAAEVSGWSHVAWDDDRSRVAFDVIGVRLDFGGIGKGLAADAALEILRSLGVGRAVVDAGGDVAASDPPPGAAGWQVSLPDGARAVWLANAAIASSGDTYRHVDAGGVRYSHILDPSTGRGRTTGRTVTVFAADGETADALATAFSATDPDRLRGLVPEAAWGVLITGPGDERWLMGRLPDRVDVGTGPSDCRAGHDRVD